jgi:uncharacterized protein YgiM (DUF1202 family)
MTHYRSRRRASVKRNNSFSPVVGFLLIAGFGILFAGCSGPSDSDDEYVFTAEDAAKFQELAKKVQQGDRTGTGEQTGTGSTDEPYLEPLDSASGALAGDIPTLDLSMVNAYNGIRTAVSADGGNSFRVSNEFVNVRSNPSVGAATVSRLNRGDAVEVMEFVNARWAKVKVGGGIGYVSTDYIAKLTTDEKLPEEKKQYEGQYFVNFGFVNLRKDKTSSSEKLAEIPGQTILKPIAVEGDWMKVSFDGKEGYVSNQYLKPFLPNFLVRQNSFTLPIIQYRLSQGDVLKAMPEQLAKLKAEGATFMQLREFSDLLLRQEQRDVRLNPKTVSIIVTGVTPSNVKQVSDILMAASVKATLFIQTKDIGINGITEKMLMTLMANGFDLQSGGHTGDDLRSLTNSQIELELKQSRQLLEEYTKKTVFAVAYPQGGVNERVMQLAAAAGYLFGIGSESDATFTRDQFLRLPSTVVFPSTTSDELVKIVKGS